MTPAQTLAIEKLRAMNRELEAQTQTLASRLVIDKIEIVIALLEDDPTHEQENVTDLRCRFPKCNCTFPRRCRA